MIDPGCVTVKEWSVSFYHNAGRRWKYGGLRVTPDYVIFTENETDIDEPYVKAIRHCDVTDVRKSLTGLIFRAIVLTLSNKEKFWISSMSDQTSVFNVLQYFQHQNLISPKNPQTDQKKTSNFKSTDMGQKLLKSVHDSESTLCNAANALQHQGTQIQSSLATMYDIHSDLYIADNMLSGLENWLGKWKIPQQYKKETLEIVQSSDLPEELDYEVLYTKLEMGKMNCQYLGILRVCPEGLIILTDKQKVVYNFKWNNISAVKVLSLCEIMVIKYFIGQPDLTCDLVGSSFLPVLRLLDRHLKSKMEYKEDIFRQERINKHPVIANTGKLKGQLFSKKEPSPKVDNLLDIDTTTGDRNEVLQTQVQGQKQIVSDQEVEEISQTLQNIKSIALTTGQELDAQSDSIDKLTNSVDIANQRLNKNEKRIRGLLG